MKEEKNYQRKKLSLKKCQRRDWRKNKRRITLERYIESLEEELKFFERRYLRAFRGLNIEQAKVVTSMLNALRVFLLTFRTS